VGAAILTLGGVTASVEPTTWAVVSAYSQARTHVTLGRPTEVCGVVMAHIARLAAGVLCEKLFEIWQISVAHESLFLFLTRWPSIEDNIVQLSGSLERETAGRLGHC